jgi:hypothetical protein
MTGIRHELLSLIDNGLDIYSGSRLTLTRDNNIDSEVVHYLAYFNNTRAITYLYVSYTRVGYSGIIELSKSDTFGSLLRDAPTYCLHTGSSVSTITIDITATRAYD